MSRRYKGAVISATPPTTTGGASGTAPGAWTLQQQFQAQGGSVWPSQPIGWIGYFSWASNNVGLNGVVFDSSGNLFLSGDVPPQSGSAYNAFLTIKMNSSGTLQWQKLISTAAVTSASYNVSYATAIDSSGNVYNAGGVSSNSYFGYVKLDTSGAALSKQQYQFTAISACVPRATTVDSSGNIYLAGYGQTPYACCSTRGIGAVLKLDSTGTLLWRTKTENTSGGYDVTFLGCAVDSSGNVYAGGQAPTASSDGFVQKYNSSGTSQWQFLIKPPTNHHPSLYGATIVSGNPTFIASNYITSTYNLFVIQFNSSGGIVWQTAVFAPSGNLSAGSITSDASGNIYVTGTAGASSMVVVKLNSSGVVQWQRSISVTGKSLQADKGPNIAITSNGLTYAVYGTILDTKEVATVLNLPTDGSGTGTFVVGSYTYTYATYAGTSSSSAYTTSASTLNVATMTVTTSAQSWVVSTGPTTQTLSAV